MKDSKISLLLLVSLSLLLLAFVVLFIWGFTYYKQSINGSQSSTIIVKDSSTIANGIRDSLQKIYTASIKRLYSDLDSTARNSDSMQVQMDEKLQEFVDLKNEISQILATSNTPAEISTAKKRLTDLQVKLDEWRMRYNDVSQENRRLSQLLRQLSLPASSPSANADAPASQMQVANPARINSAAQPQAVRTSANVSTIPAENAGGVSTEIENSPGFSVAGIQLKASADKEGDAAEANDVITGSFTIKNNQQSLRSAEIFVVLLQPDGKVMKQSEWESGLFETAQGRKIYSARLRFDYTKAENKTLNFSIPADQRLQGTYTLQLFYNGKLIGRASKIFS